MIFVFSIFVVGLARNASKSAFKMWPFGPVPRIDASGVVGCSRIKRATAGDNGLLDTATALLA
jgi:hypothetical protein